MKPKRIFLIRHGESQGNIDKDSYKHTPDWQVPLTNQGATQAAFMARNLLKKIGDQSLIIFSSPWKRAEQTAQALRVAFPRAKYYQDPRLREQEWGNFKKDGLSLKIEKERYRYGTFFYRIPYGESGADVYDRISAFLETLHRDFRKFSCPRNVIVVSHGLTIKTFLMRWFHWSVEEFEKMKTPRNCEVFEIHSHGLIKKRWSLRTPVRV